MENEFRRTAQFDSHPINWWLDVKAVMDCNGIKNANELEDRLNRHQVMDAASRDARICLNKILEKSDLKKLPRPTIGRIVHYISGSDKEWPAMIIDVIHLSNPSVYLQVFSNYGVAAPHTTLSEYCDAAFLRKLTWHWPERED